MAEPGDFTSPLSRVGPLSLVMMRSVFSRQAQPVQRGYDLPHYPVELLHAIADDACLARTAESLARRDWRVDVPWGVVEKEGPFLVLG